MAVGKKTSSDGTGVAKPTGSNAPGSVKRRAKTPAALKGSKKKGAGTGGNVTVAASGKTQTTTIGNRKAGFAKTGISKQFLG